GSQRVALRASGVMTYLLGDHLGSTAITTDATGAMTSELRYRAFGDTRYSTGTLPTKYRFTPLACPTLPNFFPLPIHVAARRGTLLQNAPQTPACRGR